MRKTWESEVESSRMISSGERTDEWKKARVYGEWMKKTRLRQERMKKIVKAEKS